MVKARLCLLLVTSLKLCSMQTPQRMQQAGPASNENVVLHYDRTLYNDYKLGENNPHHSHALIVAILTGNKVALQHYLRKFSVETYCLITLLIKHGQADYFEQFLNLINSSKIPFDIDEHPENSESLLRIAYSYLMQEPNNKNRLKILTLILKNNAAITEDVLSNNIDAVRLYLQNGFSIYQLDEYWNTPLFLSVAYGHLEMVQLLLQYHVPPYAQNSPQEYLVKAVESNNISSVINALRAGINGDVINEKGEHILAIAARNKNAKIIHLLIHYGQAGLRYLLRQGDKTTITYILESAPCHFSNTERKALICIAQKHGQQVILKLLEEFDQKMSDYGNEDTPVLDLDNLTLISEASSNQVQAPYEASGQQRAECAHPKYPLDIGTMLCEILNNCNPSADDPTVHFRLPETCQNTRALTNNTGNKTLYNYSPDIIVMHEILLRLFLPITHKALWDGLRENILAFLRKKQQFNSKDACIKTLISILKKHLSQLKLDQLLDNNFVRELQAQLQALCNRPDIEKHLIQLGLLPRQARAATTSQSSATSSASSSSVTSSSAHAASQEAPKVRLGINLHMQAHVGLMNPQSYSALSSASTSSAKATAAS